jgi:hypothetical protein
MGSRVTLYAGDLLLRHASDHANRRCLYGSCAEQYGAGCRLLQRGFRARNILASAIGRFIEDFDLPNLKDEWALSMSFGRSCTARSRAYALTFRSPNEGSHVLIAFLVIAIQRVAACRARRAFRLYGDRYAVLITLGWSHYAHYLWSGRDLQNRRRYERERQ